MGVGILRLQSGLDFSQQVDDDQNNGDIARNQSYSQLSQSIH